MRTICAIILSTIKQSFRNKLIGGVALFGLILIGLSNLFSYFSIEEQLKFIKDLGLSGVTFFGLIIAILIGSSVISDDYSTKSIQQVYSNPVTSCQYILGRYVGIFVVLFIYILFFCLVFYFDLLLYYLLELYREMSTHETMPFFLAFKKEFVHVYTENIVLFPAIVLIFMQMMIISALSILCSFFFSKIITFIVCFLIFIFGHITLFFNLYKESLSYGYQLLISLFSLVFPCFEYFNIADYVVLNRTISISYLSIVFFYGIVYIVPMLVISMIIFDKKEIK
ncbi:hypothetical protein ACFL1T_04365 [Chlamydiota bacterium]